MIFKPELVEKILAGEKTMTRRPVKRVLTTDEDGNEWTNVAICRYRVGYTYAVQPGWGQKGVARIKVTSVRRERWQDISPEDAVAEGFGPWNPEREARRVPVDRFADYVRGLYPDLNPASECWVIEFKPVPGPVTGGREVRACPSCGGSGTTPGTDNHPCGSCDGEGTVDW